MKSVLLVLMLCLGASGCATIKNMMAKQERLQNAVENKTYEMNVSELKQKVVEYFGGWRTVNPNENAKRIKADIDEGFVYSGKYYQKYEPGLVDFFSAMATRDKDYISEFFTQTNYHTLKDDENGFKFVFDGMVFEGQKVGDNQSKLMVHSFNNVEHGPYELDVDFAAFFLKYGSLFTIRQGPVLLEDSMQHARRDSMTEIDLFKTIDPNGYEQVTQEL